MGSHVEDVMDGIFCGMCGDLIDGNAPGYPRLCESCEEEE